ncbi:hypothetical protein JHD49_11330 [Sulfurimonas sp. SAG-AH-194-C21]|nr:hypothetical protein [Sulfurimonas sp. SAG-AH-194-C21]MDF1884531.1 hypothetical protein [Sulfurimonas sp. SAG-AH-194-C21]
MELKDVILSTLAEMEDTNPVQEETDIKQTASKEEFFEATPQVEQVFEQTSTNTSESELMYLNSIRERLLVLFEGFQAPNNSNIEAKVDMTLNFLEYTLATIDLRVKKLEKEQ